MGASKFLHQHPLPAALLLLALSAILLGLVFVRPARRGDAAPGAPVVYGQPLRAVHSLDAATAPVAPASAATENGQPRLALSGSFYNFGALRSLAAVSHDFYIINRGDAPLVILRAFTTCGCTTAELSASVIPPGWASRVTVTFDPAFHDLSGQTVQRGLILETNDPDQPEAAIWVQATLR